MKKKIMLTVLAAVVALSAAGCGSKKDASSAASTAASAASAAVSAVSSAAAEAKDTAVSTAQSAAAAAQAAVSEASASLTSLVEEVPDAAGETFSAVAAAAVESMAVQAVSGAESVAEAPAGPMSYADFMAAEVDTPVVVETYVQAKQALKDGKVSVYAQSEDGGYFIYGMACSDADYEKLTEGQKITVTGFKGEWSGEIEIMDATFELGDGTYVAPAHEANELLGAADIDKIMNQRAAFDELTVEASKDPDGKEAAFLYNWDGSGAEGDDIYFNAGADGKSITFVVETDLTPADSDVYKAVQNLKVGDKIDLSAFMYWYEGPQPHVYEVEVAE